MQRLLLFCSCALAGPLSAWSSRLDELSPPELRLCTRSNRHRRTRVGHARLPPCAWLEREGAGAAAAQGAGISVDTCASLNTFPSRVQALEAERPLKHAGRTTFNGTPLNWMIYPFWRTGLFCAPSRLALSAASSKRTWTK